MEEVNTLLEDLFQRSRGTPLPPPVVVISAQEADTPYVIDARISDDGARVFDRDALLSKLKGAMYVMDRRIVAPRVVKTTTKVTLIEYPSAAPAIEEEDKTEEEETPEAVIEEEEKVPEAVIEEEEKAPEAVVEEEAPKAPKAVIEEEEKVPEEVAPKAKKAPAKRVRISKKNIVHATDIPPTNVEIHGTTLQQRVLPSKSALPPIKINPRYLSNRKMFIGQLARVFEPYHKEFIDNFESMTCDSIRKQGADAFDLLTHQKVIRDYLHTFTPYRGLVLFHGLGSGKTCTSIAVAESMKSDKQVVFMTPASLKMNFMSELKKCGDPLYKKLQYWEFVKTFDDPSLAKSLAQSMQLSLEYVTKKRGVWLVNMQKHESNYDTLTPIEQSQVDEQLNEMIHNKYTSINYNGIHNKGLDVITDNGKRNPFDNKTVIIDEAHNFVSRIVNAIRAKKQKSKVSYRLYKLLMDAENAKVVLLTGTPILNHPYELSILYNMIRGNIDQWTFYPENPVDESKIKRIFEYNQFTLYDIVTADKTQINITRNPFGFVSTDTPEAPTAPAKTQRRIVPAVTKANAKRVTKKAQIEGTHIGGGESGKVVYDESGKVTNLEFLKRVKKIFAENDISLKRAHKYTAYTALPESPDAFDDKFIDFENATIRNGDMFKRRIVGLTSYFRSVEDKLLPRFEKTDTGSNYHIVEVPMSSTQFVNYAKVRSKEIMSAKKSKTAKAMKPNDKTLFQSSYRIFSRLACNYSFPKEVTRPMPGDIGEGQHMIEEILEEEVDSDEQEGEKEQEEEPESKKSVKDIEVVRNQYQLAIQSTMELLSTRKDEFLTDAGLAECSPKFRAILRNVFDEENRGLHLIYSQFRTLEGIGILALVLEANGYTQFKLIRESGTWKLDSATIDALERNDRLYVLYTGTESAEEKEVVRNIYNSAWNEIPSDIADILRKRADNNNMGDVIRAMLITASAAEGINLKCTRYVHIVEPYWNMVRIEQVVGRARRICSHQDLPEELRTVKVFFYMTKFSDEQLKNPDKDTQILRLDVGRIDKNKPLTTDQSIYETASIKTKINNAFLDAVKSTAMDCSIYSRTKEDTYVCYGYGRVTDSTAIASYPTLEEDARNVEQEQVNVRKESVQGFQYVRVKGVKYGYKPSTKNIYDGVAVDSALAQGLSLESLEPIGKLVETDEGVYIEFFKNQR